MRNIRYCLLIPFCITASLGVTGSVAASGYWRAPFEGESAATASVDSVLSLGDALRLAAAMNPALKSRDFDLAAADARMEQAGLRSNPEFEVEFEEIGWDAPGFRESEITVSVAQEFELFGQRGARKRLALAEIDAATSHADMTAFDLYLDVKRRFYALAHAQHRLHLSQTSVRLATDIVQNINLRIKKGAALQSELLLAQLETQRTQLMLDQAQLEEKAAEVSLAALWGGGAVDIRVVVESEPDVASLMHRVASLEGGIDSTRGVRQLHRQSAIVRAERSLAAAEARPGITLSGGVKRLEGNNSNSFLVGVSLPLPLFNRNQGARGSLEAQVRSLEHRIDRERLDAAAEIQTHSIRLRELVRRHDMLDTLLLPTAEDIYNTLQRAYEAGRVPYTQLLEAKRSLNELRFEHNDMILAIHERIIAMESLTGVCLRIDGEN